MKTFFLGIFYMSNNLQYFIDLKRSNLIRLRDLLNSGGSISDLQQSKDTNDLLNYNISILQKSESPIKDFRVSIETKNIDPYSDFSKYSDNNEFKKINQVSMDQTFLLPLETIPEEPIKIAVEPVKVIDNTPVEKLNNYYNDASYYNQYSNY